jgi:hypothetical protein
MDQMANPRRVTPHRRRQGVMGSRMTYLVATFGFAVDARRESTKSLGVFGIQSAVWLNYKISCEKESRNRIVNMIPVIPFRFGEFIYIMYLATSED